VKKAIEKLDNEIFIVINRKRFKELNDTQKKDDGAMFKSHTAVLKLEMALYNFVRTYEEETGKQLGQKYIVCNQDEPYADEVARLVLGGKPRWETPEQWKKRTGEKYPDKAPVWCADNDNPADPWFLDYYKNAVDDERYYIICAVEGLVLPDDWRPEEENDAE
jgi:hypothetical protein